MVMINNGNGTSKRALFIGAHPDDVEIGCLGTINRHVRNKDKVFVMVVTDGERGNGNPKKYDRLRESIGCLGQVGVSKSHVIPLHLPDTGLFKSRDLLFDKIENFCLKENVDTIYVSSEKDYHQDHVVIFDETVRAARMVPNLLRYESTSSTLPTFSPNLFIDISEFIDEKSKLLKSHQSQNGKHYLKDGAVKALAKFRGNQVKSPGFAEAFEIFRMVITD